MSESSENHPNLTLIVSSGHVALGLTPVGQVPLVWAKKLGDGIFGGSGLHPPNGTRVGNEWCVGNLDGAPGKSLKVHLTGEKAGLWKDFSSQEGGDLVELWTQVKKVSKSEAIKEIHSYLSLPGQQQPTGNKRVQKVFPMVEQSSTTKKIANEYHSSIQSRLQRNDKALAYLEGPTRGLTRETIKHFGLGLSQPYERSDGTVTQDAVIAPMRSPETGNFLSKSAYICVPDVTQNPLDKNGWMKGSPECYYAEKLQAQRVLFICEGLKDVWRHWQALKEDELTDRIAIVTSTHGTSIPLVWKTPEFWSRWDSVYLGQDNDEAGETLAERVQELAGVGMRIRVPKELGKDWTDFWQNGGTIDVFRELLMYASVTSSVIIKDAPAAAQESVQRIGRFTHKPVDINGAYINGHLYYPTETHLIRKDEESGILVERLETIVIRSDRTVHRALYAPAPPGTPPHKRVLKLSDGTVIEKEPQAGPLRTWDYESIAKYRDGKAKTRSLIDIVHNVVAILKKSIWLPYEEDYASLALTVPVTYLQAVFESVPLLLMNGPAGSGKSQTGNTMAKLCANGVVIGQVSAASAARLIDETRGFVVLDDVESIAAKAGKDIQASEFVQALKVSYNKHTGIKYWTDVKTMKIEKLNFYGVKLLSNTLGADAILGTRMIRIQTRKMPDGMKSTVRDFSAEDLTGLTALRNELHTWAFENVSKVDKAYREIYANKTDRHNEIAAPLRTMAQIVGDHVLTSQLEMALARQHTNPAVLNDDPVETLKDAVRNLIKQGYETVTLTHLKLEMRSLLDANYGMELTNSIAEWDRPEWVGRQLRSNDLVSDVDPGRKRFFGKNLRMVKFSDWVIKEVTATHDEYGNPIYVQPEKNPEAFCQGCNGCPYRTAGCELQELRVKEESQRPMNPH